MSNQPTNQQKMWRMNLRFTGNEKWIAKETYFIHRNSNEATKKDSAGNFHWQCNSRIPKIIIITLVFLQIIEVCRKELKSKFEFIQNVD